jgi:hypothetical protein
MRQLQKLTQNNRLIVTECEGPEGCETSRLQNCLHSRLTNGGESVKLTRRPPYNPGKNTKLSNDQREGGRMRQTSKFNYLIENRTRGFPAHNRVPQPTTLPRASVLRAYRCNHIISGVTRQRLTPEIGGYVRLFPS